LGLALLSLIVLIYFFHHMALSMQAPYIVGEVADDLLRAIERLFPSEVGSGPPPNADRRGAQDIPADFEKHTQPILYETSGYLQAIDESELLTIANQDNLIVKLLHRPGHFQVKGDVMAYVWPGVRLDDNLKRRLRSTHLAGKQRTYTQDVEFGIEQLVEVAERSLSTGINATFTAVACIDWLGAALAKLCGKDFPSPYRYDEEGNLRIFFERPLTLEGVIDTAFNQIRQSARDNVAVRIRLLEQIAILHEMTEDPRAIEVLERHAKMIEDDSDNHALQQEDKKEVDERYRDATGASEDHQGTPRPEKR
jgi:uncharacterized membrane protein